LIALGFGEFDQHDGVFGVTLDRAHGIGLGGEAGAFAEQGLGRCGVVPELRVFGLGIQAIEFVECGIPVKDASSAGPRFA
jgi:hypothetical protein